MWEKKNRYLEEFASVFFLKKPLMMLSKIGESKTGRSVHFDLFSILVLHSMNEEIAPCFPYSLLNLTSFS